MLARSQVGNPIGFLSLPEAGYRLCFIVDSFQMHGIRNYCQVRDSLVENTQLLDMGVSVQGMAASGNATHS